VTIRYTSVPTAHQFQKDSSVFLATRSEDRILCHLDWLLQGYALRSRQRDTRNKVYLCDLFVTANYWMKLYYARKPHILKERYPAVFALFEAVVEELRKVFRCPRADVGNRIREIFGRELTTGGASTDLQRGGAKYYDRAELALYRLRFKSGLVYNYESDAKTNATRLVPLDTAKFYSHVRRIGQVQTAGWASFVMTIEREFYMSIHYYDDPNPSQPNIFHSAYNWGRPLSMAGTIKAEKGRILGIRNDSGHYQPGSNQITGCLQALAMFGVPLQPIRVVTFDGNDIGNGDQVVRAGFKWSNYEESRHGYRTGHTKNGLLARDNQITDPPPAPTQSGNGDSPLYGNQNGAAPRYGRQISANQPAADDTGGQWYNAD
jgi:hypothetical protein